MPLTRAEKIRQEEGIDRHIIERGLPNTMLAARDGDDIALALMSALTKGREVEMIERGTLKPVDAKYLREFRAHARPYHEGTVLVGPGGVSNTITKVKEDGRLVVPALPQDLLEEIEAVQELEFEIVTTI